MEASERMQASEAPEAGASHLAFVHTAAPTSDASELTGGFDNQIQNDAFEGHPKLRIQRLVEEDVVIAVGSVEAAPKGGGILSAVIGDVFHFEGDKIRLLETYQMD